MKKFSYKTHYWGVFFVFLEVLNVFLFYSCTHLPSTHLSSTHTQFDFFSSRLPPHKDPNILVVTFLNDFHGALQTEKKTWNQKTFYKNGAPLITRWIQLLRKTYPQQVLFFDIGDSWQGTLESTSTQGKIVVQWFRHLKLDAATLGNHEFDFGIRILKKRLYQSPYPYIATNLSLKKHPNTSPPWPHLVKSTLIQKGPFKIGVLGLLTLETPFSTRPQTVSKLQFLPMLSAITQEIKHLHQKGAHAIILLAHEGLFCKHSAFVFKIRSQPPTHTHTPSSCTGPMATLLKTLPPHMVDLVLSGHTHTMVHHWIAGTPIVQSKSRGRFLQMVFLHFDPITKKLLSKKTQIIGPIGMCTRVFPTGNCEIRKNMSPKLPLLQAMWNHAPIKEDSFVKAFLKKKFSKWAPLWNRVLLKLPMDIPHFYQKPSPLGLLVAKAFQSVAHTQIGFVNAGGIRNSWEKGPLTYRMFFQTLPFENQVSKLTLKGSELILLLKTAFDSKKKGLFSVSGLKIFLNKNINRSQNRFIRATLKNHPIQLNRYYTLATIDFLADGGDGLLKVMKHIPKNHIQRSIGISMRKAVLRYLKKISLSKTNLPKSNTTFVFK